MQLLKESCRKDKSSPLAVKEMRNGDRFIDCAPRGVQRWCPPAHVLFRPSETPKRYRSWLRSSQAIARSIAAYFKGSYAVTGPVDRHIHVDAKIPGCPPRPAQILEALAALRRKS